MSILENIMTKGMAFFDFYGGDCGKAEKGD